MRPFCCSLADLEEACEEVGLHPTVAASEPEEVAPALQGLLQRGALQPLLDEHCWNALVGAKKLSSKQEMLGRRLDGRLRGLCSTINGVGMSRPRSPVDSLFFLVTVEHMVRVCNRLCCSLELTPIGASDKDAPGTVRLLPGEDADCPDLDSMQLELLLPRSDARVAMARSKSSSFRASVTSMAEEENEMLEEEEEESPSLPERYVLQRPQRLLEPGGAMTAGGPVRSQQSLLGRNKAPCCFKGKGDKLVEVQVQKEEGVVQEHCYWPGLHCTQFGSHTSQLTLFVSHWLVNRQNAPVVIPHPRSVGLSRSRHVVDEPMMVIPGHGLRPLSQHALADGSLEIGLRAPEASEAPGHTPSNARPSLQRTVRRRKTLFASQKGSKTGSIKVDRPRKGGVLPFLAVEDGPDSLCLGFSVNQAPFPFYRTLVVEVTRRYTLVNLKNHRLWVSDGHNYLHLMPGKPQAYHPHGGDAEFHLDISGVGPKEFTAGFRLSQLFKLAGDDTGRRGKLQLMYMAARMCDGNETKWPVTVRADSSDAGQTIDLEEEVDLWPSSKNEMLFQMKRSGVDAKGNSFEWSQPLTLSESMTTYRGFFRQRCGGEADTVEVSVARDELSGFLRLTLSACKQDPFLIENKSSEKCRFAPKNATGWVMHLQKGDGECPFFSHLWGGDTWMTLTLSARGESHESFDFDLAVPHTHHFRDLIIEVGKVKDKPKLVVVRDTTEKQTKSLTRRSIRERGVLGTLNRMSVAFRADHLAPALELGVQKLQSLASQNGKNEMKTVKSHVTFATDEDQEEEQPQHRLFTMGSGNHLNPMKSLESLNLQPRRFIEWMTMTSSLTSMPTLRPRRCLCFRCFGRKEKAVEPLRRKKAVRMKPARSNLMGQEIDELDWSLDLRLEGLGVAMLEMQLDTRESHELGYGSLKGLTVQLRQVAAKTDVDGRGGSLWVDLKLRSAHLDVGTGDLKHQSKACHSVLRPFTGPLQILSEDGEPPAILHLEAMLKLITENQEVAPRLIEPQAATGPSRNGSAHYEVRRFELKVQPLGLHIETALVSEVVLWVLELSSVLKSGTQRQESHMQHLANALDAEENNAEPNVALADLRFCEPRCVTDPTAEDFQDRTPVVIRELLLRRICCVMTLSFTGTGSWRSDRDEELQALEMLLRLTLPLDVHQARLMLGKLVFGWRGWSVKDFTVRERFLSNGTEEFADTLLRELSRAVLQQVPKLFGSQLLIGNPRRLGEELLRAAELGAMGITRLQPKVVLAAFLLGLAAFTTSLRGMFLIVSKEGCRAVTGQVPDQLLREPSRVRQSLAQAIYYGLPWHGYRLALRLRQRWKEWSHRCSCCEGLKLLLASLLWIILAPISALLVTVTKILQALELISRRTARWASPTHVTAIGPPTPMRTGSQQFVAGYPKQFSRSAAPALEALKMELASGTPSAVAPTMDQNTIEN
ncbi:Hypothetical protein SCF082_LOCUS31013 [Durusdinium trenchii]|uniref:Uncharacterized protein n=1 Tax=Durusdinium trenchii TaxID=1381693 RepID=A0ABP0N6Q1_9DINO